MTDYLLDTSAFLWSLGPAERLNRRAREIIEEAGQRVFFSPQALAQWDQPYITIGAVAR